MPTDDSDSDYDNGSAAKPSPTGARLAVGAKIAGKTGLYKSVRQKPEANDPVVDPDDPDKKPEPSEMTMTDEMKPAAPRQFSMAGPPTTEPGAPSVTPRSLFSAPAASAPPSPRLTSMTPAKPMQQTESENPLTGDSNAVPAGASEPVQMSKGAGSKFAKPSSSSIYDQSVRGLFSPKGTPSRARTGMRRAPSNAVS